MVSRSFDDVDRMFEQMDHMLDSMWTRVSDRDGGLMAPWSRHEAAFDLHANEDEDGYVLVVDLPGFEKDEIDIRATETHILVDATHESERGTSFQRRNVSERFAIPADVDVEDVSASYHNGVLEISLPVEGEIETGRNIEIE